MLTHEIVLTSASTKLHILQFFKYTATSEKDHFAPFLFQIQKNIYRSLLLLSHMFHFSFTFPLTMLCFGIFIPFN